MKHKHLAVFLVFLFFLAASYQASFGGEGKIVLNPHINVSWQMDSNFWWAETDEKEVHTYLIQPGALVGYQTDKSLIYLDYTMNGYMYDDRDAPTPGIRKASEDNYLGHTLQMFASTRQLGETLLLGIREDFFLTRDPAQSDIFSDSTLRDKYIINQVEPFAFYDFSDRATAGLRYRNTITNYSPSYMEDSTENRGMLDLIYHISDSTSLDLGYQIWARDYSKGTSDYLSNKVMLTFKKQLRHLSVEAAAGYHHRSFDEKGLDSMQVIPWRASIEWATDPTPISPLLPLEKKRSYVRLTAEQDFNDQGLGENYFKADRITLKAGHVFWERIPVEFNGYYQRSKYEFTRGLTSSGSSELRDDDTYKVYCSVGYMFLRWFTLSIRPGYEKRNSNIAGRSYEDKTIMALLQFNYMVGGK